MKYLKRFILLLLASALVTSSAFAFRSSIGFWRPAQFVDYISALFNQGVSNGTILDTTNNYVRLSQTASGSTNELNSGWSPEWVSILGLWHMDEASWNGTSGEVIDSSGQGNSGTGINGAITIAGGQLYRAGSFQTSSSQYVNLGTAINPTASTYTAWIKATSFPNSYTSVISRAEGAGPTNTLLIKPTGKLACYVAAGSGVVDYDGTGTYTLNTGQWYFLAMAYDSVGGLNCYVNGALDGHVAPNGSLTQAAGQATWIGGHPTIGGRFFNGLIDEAAIWSKALTITEIQTIYSTQSSPYVGNNSELDSSWAPSWSNLVSYLKLDEVAGNGSAADSSSVGTNTGTVVGGVSQGVNGKLGYAATFDGSSGYITTNNSFSNPNSITLSAWIKTTTTSGGSIITLINGSNFDRMLYMDSSGIVYFGVYTSTAVTISSSPAICNDGNWHYLVGTLSGSGMALYIDGALAGSNGTTNGFNYSGTWQIGLAPLSGSNWPATSSISNYFNGTIDDVAVWNTGLSAASVALIYQRESVKYSGTFTSRVMDGLAAAMQWTSMAWTPTLPFFKELPDGDASESSSNYSSQSSGLMSGNVGLWHLDEVVGTSGTNSVLDKSGNGNNGTPEGTLTFGTSGKLGTAATFDGSSAYIGGIGLAPSGTSDWTESAWIKTSNTNAGVIVTNRGYSANASLTLDVGIWGNDPESNGNVYFSLDESECEYGVQSSVNVADGNWHHVVGTRIAYNFSVYVDGVLQTPAPLSAGGSCQFASAVSTDPWQIGWGPQWSNSYFNGSIDELGIWNRGLSSSEVLELYRRGANRIKYQVRTCPDGTCSTNPTWLGPDGTNQTYFSELNNNAVQNDGEDLSGSDSVNASPPVMKFANFDSLSVPAGRYFQYRAVMESDDTGTACNYGSGATWCSPELQSVTAAP